MLQTSKYHATTSDLSNEQTLVEAAKKDAAKFATLYDKYYEQIFRFIYQRLDDKEQAFDSTQQVFVKALEKLSKYEFNTVLSNTVNSSPILFPLLSNLKPLSKLLLSNKKLNT